MSLSRKKWTKSGILLLAVLTVFLNVFSNSSTVSAEKAIMSVHNQSGNINVPIVKPAWTIAVDKSPSVNSNMDQQQAVAEDGKVFAFANKQLIAVNAVTGKKIWSYGDQLQPVIIYHQGILIGLTQDHKIYALDAKSGKKKWVTSIKWTEDTSLVPQNDTLYVLQPQTTHSIDLKSGKLNWSADEPSSVGGSGTDIIESDGVVIRSFVVQGALSYIQTDGFDQQTGKKLWDISYQSFPLAVKDGLVYSVFYNFALDTNTMYERHHIVNVFNVKTGEKKGERMYKWKLPADYNNPGLRGGMNGSMFLDGDDLYVFQGNVIAKYDFANYKLDGKPIQKWIAPSDVTSPLPTIHQGRMFFRSSSDLFLSGMKLKDGQQIGWYGDNPAAQIDMYGNGIYSAQTDGVFYAYNLLTTSPVLSVITGSRYYGPTLKTGQMAIIQAEGKLIGITIPTALK